MGRATASGMEGAMAMACRWSCLDCAAIASYVAPFRTGSVCSRKSKYPVPGTSPGYVYTRSSPSPEPESSALESRTRSRVVFSRVGDRRYAVTPLTLSRPVHPPVSLGCSACTGAAEVYHVLVHRYHRNTSARIPLLYDVCKILERTIPGAM